MAAFTPVGVEFVAKGIRQFESRINHVNDNILDLSDSIEKMGEQAAENASRGFDRLQTSLSDVQGDVRSLGGAFGQQAGGGGGLSTFLDMASNLGSVIGGIGSVVGGAITAVVDLGKAMISAAIDGAQFLAGKLFDVIGASTEMATAFESSISLLAGAAGSEIRAGAIALEELDKITLKIGGDQRLMGISAMEAAAATTEFYKAGLTTQQIYGDKAGYLADETELMGVLRAAIDMAASSELDLVDSSSLAITLLNTFGKAAEAAGMDMDVWIVDKMNDVSKTADASNASVSDLFASYGNVAAIAADFGFTLEDVNIILAMMSDQNNKAATAGTNLASMLTNITGVKKKTTKALDDLNVKIYGEGDAMNSLGNIMGQLNERFNETRVITEIVGGRTKEQNAELKRLRGMYAGAAQDLSDYEKGLTGVGMKEETRQKSMEKLRIKMMNAGTEIAKLETIQGTAIQRTVEWTDKETAAMKLNIAGSYGKKALSAALAGGEDDWEKYRVKIEGATNMEELAAKRAATLKGRMEALEGIMETLSITIGDPFRELKKEFLSAALPIVETYGPKVADMLAGIGESLRTVGDVVFAMDWDAIVGDLFTGDLSSLTEGLSLAGLELGIPEGAITFITNLITKGQELVLWLQETIPTAIATASSYWSGTLWPAMQSVWGWIQETGIPIFQEVSTWLKEQLPGAIERGAEFWEGTLQPAIESVQGAFDNILAFWAENGPSIQETASTVFEKFAEVSKDLSENIIPWLAEKIEVISAWFEENGPLIAQEIENWAELWGKIQDAVTEAWDIVEPLLDGLLEIILEIAEITMEVSQGDWPGAWESIQEIAESAAVALEEAFEEYLDFIVKALGGESWQEVEDQWSENWDMFTTILGIWWEGVVEKFEEWWEDVKQFGKDFMEGLAEGIEDAKDMVWNAIKGVVKGAIAAGWELLKAKSPSKVFMDMGMSVGEGLAVGIQNSLPLVGSALGEMSSMLAGGMSSMGQMGLALSGAGGMSPAGAGAGAVAAPPVYSSRNLSVGPVNIQNGMDEARFMALFRRAIRTEMGGV